MEQMERPLDGLVVLDLTRALSGPICTCILADYGARVIKVEGLGGDMVRGGAPDANDADRPSEVFRSFSAINRNKDSLSMDLRDPECKEIFRNMLRSADILISNFRPGTTKKMGIDYDSVKALNPRLICCEISAFREKGREQEPGYDVVVQAASGIIAATGYPGQPPCKPGPSMADIASGLVMVQGILLAVIQRGRTGRGQEVTVRMQDAAMFMMAQYCTQLIDNPAYEFRPNGMAHIEATPSNGFKTADGYIFTAPAGEKLFPIFCNVIGMPELPTDPRFDTVQHLIDNRSILYDEILGPMFLTRTTQAWYELLSAAGLPVSPIATPKQAWNKACEQGAPIVAAVEHPRFGTMHVPGVAAGLSETPGHVDKYAPYLGENTAEVLEQLGGLSRAQIDRLAQRGAIHIHGESGR